MNALGRLADFARRRTAEDRCGLCAAPLGDVHPHLVRVESGRLLCSCPGCASVLAHPSAAFRRVPDRVAPLADFRMTGEEWADFAVPVGVAFFQIRRGAPVAFYPSPIGPVETTVPASAWARVLEKNPALASLEPDVEALLVRRDGPRSDAFIVPLDACYGLIGVLRRAWRGLTGGDGVVRAVEEYFDALRARSLA